MTQFEEFVAEHMKHLPRFAAAALAVKDDLYIARLLAKDVFGEKFTTKHVLKINELIQRAARRVRPLGPLKEGEQNDA